jgi:hypothetical protein
VVNPVPRTVAVVVGVFTSKRESARVSFCTLAQVRPTAWVMEIVIEPLALEVAVSTVTVVDGSSSMVEPSKNVTSA